MSNSIIKARKTFALTIWSMMDDAVISTETFTLTITRFADGTARCERDGVEISELDALAYGDKARWSGKMTLIVEFVAPVVATLNKRAAATLHRDLSRLGYTRSLWHYQLATEALERPVASLTEITAQEANTVYSYAQAQMGMSSTGWAA